jgi:pimeloyl-ACP methyl ester carboxylesterase/predicted glycosyltransferase
VRALEPDYDGYAERNGVKVFYEVFNDAGSPTVMLHHGWPLAPGALWKMQVGFLARHYRVIAWDWPTNGRSDRPSDPNSLLLPEVAAHIPSIMEATSTQKAIWVGVSGGVMISLAAAMARPDLVSGMVLVGGAVGGAGEQAERDFEMLDALLHFDEEPVANPTGWQLMNAKAWESHWDEFVEFFVKSVFPEPHSTKAVEDFIGWASGTTAELQTAFFRANLVGGSGAEAKEITGNLLALLRACAEAVTCPVLVVHGELDAQAPLAMGVALADATDGDLLVIEGAGHVPLGRDAVKFNLAVRDFVDRIHPPPPKRRRWPRAHSRPRRALFVSSPIGLGHAARDVAIANELRAVRPDVEVVWLAQDPVTRLLDGRGEVVHAASRHLVNESAHIECEALDHELHAFQALRRMDEILVSNFHVFHDLVNDEQFDVVVADEAWDVDYFLHENPELKRSPLCWLTDFVGYLPMADGGDHEAALTADYNAEMLEQRARYRHLRDRSIFVGNADDVVDGTFGAGLPEIRAWTEANFAFPGYISGFDPASVDAAAVRAQFGWRDDEVVCVAAVGGSGVGRALLQKIVAAREPLAASIPGLRLVAVAGPRIDPASLGAPTGVDVVGYVPDLYKTFAACDLAMVQGGLTTTMELTALRKPFLYFPLENHFEQRIHVRHRLERYGAGRMMEYRSADPDELTVAIKEELARPTRYRPVETDGAAKAAALIAEVL